MPVKSINKPKSQQNGNNNVPYNFEFTDFAEFEISKNQHGKEHILAVTVFDENSEVIYPTIRVDRFTQLVKIQAMIPISGIVQIS